MAVLYALMDDFDVSYRFWEELKEYRNTEEEDEDADDDEEPLLDEFGNEVFVPQIFDGLDELRDVYGWENLEPIVQAELEGLLKVNSSVFSIFITARIKSGSEEQQDWFALDSTEIREEEERSSGLVRTVRGIFWRRDGEEEVELLPLESWEVLDYVPYEVQDYPPEDR